MVYSLPYTIYYNDFAEFVYCDKKVIIVNGNIKNLPYRIILHYYIISSIRCQRKESH